MRVYKGGKATERKTKTRGERDRQREIVRGRNRE